MALMRLESDLDSQSLAQDVVKSRTGWGDEATDFAKDLAGNWATVQILSVQHALWRYCLPTGFSPDFPMVFNLSRLDRSAIGETTAGDASAGYF